MKNLYNISLLVACLSMSLSVHGQNKKSKDESSGIVPVGSTNAIGQVKEDFVKNQSYLAPATGKGFMKMRTLAGDDSLAGFDEAEKTRDLLGRHFQGSELIVGLNWYKRDFINRKYKIGPVYGAKPAQQLPQGSSNKPIGGGGNSVNLLPCVNEDFELTPPGAYNMGNAVTGWAIESGNNGNPGVACMGNPGWTPGSPEFSIVATPVLGTPWVSGVFSIDNVTIPNSPLGGSNVARLNDSQMGVLATRMISTFPVTAANSLFQYAYAGSWDGSGHGCCDQPSFTIRLYNCPGAPLSCSSVSLTPPGVACQAGSGTYSTSGNPLVSWTNWVVNYIDLSPFIGTCITIEVVNSDCNGGAHHGTAYFDCRCGGQLVPGGFSPPGNGGNVGGPVSFCSGSNMATINAPIGYAQYQWYAPGTPSYAVGPANGGNTSTLSINNPVPGTIYTVQLVTASGCTYTAVDTLAFSSVNILGIGTNSSCPGGASGSATVAGNGSGAGYTYTWTSPAGTVVSNSQSASGLAPGIYSIGIGAFGGGCGTAGSTLAIGVGPPNTQTVVIPFCGNEAYLGIQGSNIQWYNNTTSISAVNGGAAQGYTVNNPAQGMVYRVRYLSLQNCQDSITFILNQTPSGSMLVTNVSWACPATPNGTAQVMMTPAQGAPSGLNSFTVTSPALNYTSTIGMSASTNYTALNLSPGTYTARGFDGACKYVTVFNVQGYVYDYTVTPQTSTVCAGTGVMAGVNFPMPIVPGQFQFLWTPYQFMQPANNDISVLLTPTTALGSITNYVYSVTVRPAIVNCPITKTISVTAVNLAVPTIGQFAPMCAGPGLTVKTITVSQPGGVFSSGMNGGANGNWLGNGVISPSNIAVPGTYSLMYSISISTCNVSNVTSFNVTRYNSANLTSTISNLCVTAPCVNLMGIVQSAVNGTWALTPGVNPGPTPNSFMFCPAGLQTNIYTLSYSTTGTGPNPLLCQQNSSINVSVSQTVSPSIAPIAPFCTNKPPIQMSATPPGGTWSFPSGGPLQVVSPSGLLVRANAPLGQSNVLYSILTGACTNTAITVIDATVFRSAALTGSIANLCKTSTPINLISIVSNSVSGQWSGSGVAPVGNFYQFQPLNLGTGFYTLRYNTFSAPNPNVCPDSSKIIVHVLSPATPTIVQPSPHCIADAPFAVTSNPPGGFYTATPYMDGNGNFTPAMSSVGNNQVIYTIGTATCNASDSKLVSIEAFVPATITGSLADMCNTNPNINLNALVQNTSGNWSGPGINASSFDPMLAGTGAIVITYNTSSSPSGLCPDQESLAVNIYSLATPVVTEAGPFCNSMAPVQLIVTPLGGVFKGDNNNAVTPVGLFNPAMSMVGDNFVTYSVASGPCQAEVKTIIKVEQFIPADFLPHKSEFCRFGDPLDFNSVAQNPGGEWSGDGMTGSVFTPSLANIGNNNFIHYVTHSLTYDLCPDTSRMRINVRDMPNLTLVTSKQDGCAPVEVVLNSPDASNAGDGMWYLGDGTEPKSGLSINHIFTTPGTYSVVFNYRDQIGCPGQAFLKNPIIVHEIPTADFKYGPYEEITISEPEVQFSNQTTILSNNTYEWQIGNLFKTQEVNPYVVFPAIGKYEITLTATSVYGCKDKVSHIIDIKNDFGVFIPQSFTPNEDGLNDTFGPIFTPYGLDPNTFDMEIFDRWGHSLYHTKDVNKGWDGSVANKGENVMKVDVYVYKIKYKDKDGVVYSKLGHVSIMK